METLNLSTKQSKEMKKAFLLAMLTASLKEKLIDTKEYNAMLQKIEKTL